MQLNSSPKKNLVYVPRAEISLLHRFSDIPVVNRDYYLSGANVRAYDAGTDHWTNQTVPPGISCFVPINIPHGQPNGVHASAAYSVLVNGELTNLRLVFTHVMKLKLTNGTYSQAHHYNLYPTVPMSENDYFTRLVTDTTTNPPLWQWTLCNQVAGSGELFLSSNLLEEGDLSGFLDSQIRILAYYVSEWYKNVRFTTELLLLNDLYVWLVEEKPELDQISVIAHRSRYVSYLLRTFSATDTSGQALLDDIRLSLEELFKADPSHAKNESAV